MEPFVGGANVIDKINCENKIGCDIHKQLIALLKQAQLNTEHFPMAIKYDEYQRVRENPYFYTDWYLGLVGFCSSYGAKYFGGYARNHRDDNDGSWSRGAINNLKKQAVNLKNIKFVCCDFRDIPLDRFRNYIIYCDIPYRDTTQYQVGKFPYDEFYAWVKAASKNNTVIVSEYWMPSEFTCIWSKEVKTLLDSNKSQNSTQMLRTEKLFLS